MVSKSKISTVSRVNCKSERNSKKGSVDGNKMLTCGMPASQNMVQCVVMVQYM